MGRLAGTKRKTTHKNLKLGRAAASIDRVYDEIHNPKFESVRLRTRIKPLNEDLPGLGQFYCMSCARHFVDGNTLLIHNKTKPHQRRLKELKKKPWGVDLDDVHGMKTDNGPKLNRPKSEGDQIVNVTPAKSLSAKTPKAMKVEPMD
mmetsp:Transcript_7672/g.13361  ORF Transcript_7672/g.13361 Transcript_7672/m.13361 type:complete len:147 (+) Transcript_7672:72-512(+)